MGRLRFVTKKQPVKFVLILNQPKNVDSNNEAQPKKPLQSEEVVQPCSH